MAGVPPKRATSHTHNLLLWATSQPGADSTLEKGGDGAVPVQNSLHGSPVTQGLSDNTLAVVPWFLLPIQPWRGLKGCLARHMYLSRLYMCWARKLLSLLQGWVGNRNTWYCRRSAQGEDSFTPPQRYVLCPTLHSQQTSNKHTVMFPTMTMR